MIGLGYFWQELKKRLELKIAERTRSIIGGSATSYDSYKEHVGYIAALNWVLGEARDILGNENKPRQTETEED